MFKFRARLDGKFHYEQEAARLYYNNTSESKFFHNLAEFNLFSGMKDKNNNDIYEGDILKVTNESYLEIIFLCKFGIARRKVDGRELDISSFYFENINNQFPAFPIVKNYEGKHDLEIIEIIGNKYDNFDLLLINEQIKK